MGRSKVILHGGPFDRTIIFAPEGATEYGMEERGVCHLYELKGCYGSYLGTRPLSWLTEPDPCPDPKGGE